MPLTQLQPRIAYQVRLLRIWRVVTSQSMSHAQEQDQRAGPRDCLAEPDRTCQRASRLQDGPSHATPTVPTHPLSLALPRTRSRISPKGCQATSGRSANRCRLSGGIKFSAFRFFLALVFDSRLVVFLVVSVLPNEFATNSEQ